MFNGEYMAIFLTFIKLPLAIKTFVLSIFEWPLKTGFTVFGFVSGPMSMDEVDPKYLMPFFDRLFCCLPERLLQKLRCNLPFRDPEVIVFFSVLTQK